MKRIILPLAVALAGATLASAHAADIEVAADETKTISSTPAEQPASANIHGSLTVTGGATLFPTTVNIGCAAGDDATVTVTGAKFAAQGTLEVFGLAEGALPEAITIPCQFVDCSSFDALADWQVVIAGKVRNYSAHYDPSAGQLTLLKKGLAVIVY